ncbi:MAG: T9SS type A sorting domain-containing protein, partial [Candidatus Marinimicrobia bacterium]|nr:T9SS type A sorting domain-containing protein [Candidatus Neomarinimicrobiota bacterium]
SLTWNIVANADIIENTQVDFMAYPSSLSCESLPAYCVVGDTINFSMDIVVNEPCDTGFVQIGDSCYWEADIAVLQSFIDNSQSSSNPPPLDLSPIELGYQEWDNGRLIKLCVSQSNDGCGSYVIAGNLPENISDLSHLNELNLQNNELYGSIPPAIVNMISLKILSLSNNQFTGSIPSDIGSLTNLENLHLNDNELSGLIPESFCELTIMLSPIFIDWANFSYLYENNLCFPHPNCIAGLVGSQDTSDCEPLGLADFQIPSQYSLHQNYPNPFNPVTTIQYELPKDSFVNIHIYDLNGRLVNTLISQIQAPGYKAINWNGVDSNGKTVSAGLYLYEIQAGDFRQVRKMVLLK